MKPCLLSSRFFIPLIYCIVHFQTIGMSLSLRFMNASFQRINFLLQDFRFCFYEWMISLFFKNQSRRFFRIREPGKSFVFSLNW